MQLVNPRTELLAEALRPKTIIWFKSLAVIFFRELANFRHTYMCKTLAITHLNTLYSF